MLRYPKNSPRAELHNLFSAQCINFATLHPLTFPSAVTICRARKPQQTLQRHTTYLRSGLCGELHPKFLLPMSLVPVERASHVAEESGYTSTTVLHYSYSRFTWYRHENDMRTASCQTRQPWNSSATFRPLMMQGKTWANVLQSVSDEQRAG
jgi:hypothetical protein